MPEWINDCDMPQAFLARLHHLEDLYLTSDDPIRQSGFGGGEERWRREREPILDAVSHPGGEIIDVCCANGYLLECLVEWGQDRGLNMTPFGIDIGARLVAVARKRLPQFAGNLCVANAWDWMPPRPYQYVYALWDCVPEGYLPEFIHRLMCRYVAIRGRLILGAYGSLSRHEPPFDLETFLRSIGYRVSGTAWSGTPRTACFAWLDRGTGE